GRRLGRSPARMPPSASPTSSSPSRRRGGRPADAAP
ncbi:MAG: hypothetical protein AVDCRST_MAG45-1897, partial [uncultured Solirubrobacterales bacterium]